MKHFKLIKFFSDDLHYSTTVNTGLKTYSELIEHLWLMMIFDWWNGVSTKKIIAVDKLGIEDPVVLENARRYRPSPVLCVKNSLKAVKQMDPELKLDQCEFIDYGSGMGRVLIIALMEGFKNLVGVELSEKLNVICRDNFDKLKTKGHTFKLDIYEGDAQLHMPNKEAQVFFFFRPFSEEVFNNVMSQILKSVKKNPRKIYCLALQTRYYNYEKFGLKLVGQITGVSIYTNNLSL